MAPAEGGARAAPALAVVLPAGPRDDLLDTLESVLAYTEAPRCVVVVDDHGDLPPLPPEVRILPAPGGAPGNRGGLFVKVAAGIRTALALLDADVVLRLDADALLLGGGLARAAMARFDQDERLGLLGSYRIGPDGTRRSFADAAALLGRERGLRGLGDPERRRLLRALRAAARAHGYVDGEHALGGAYLLRGTTARALVGGGYLDLPALRASRLGEDHLMGLVACAAGYRLGDFGGPDDPLALRWQGLPAPPESLLARGKLVTHSVRAFGTLGEGEIRAVFARHRIGR